MTDDLSTRLLEAIELDAGGAQADLDDPRSLHARRRRAEKALHLCQAHREIVAAFLAAQAQFDHMGVSGADAVDLAGQLGVVNGLDLAVQSLANGYGIEA